MAILARPFFLSFPPGATSETVLVPLVQDQQKEADEKLFLRLSNPMQATLESNQVEGIIRDGGSANFSGHLYLPGVMR